MSAPFIYQTSESVTAGHPDKICDQISDAILDALLEQDRGARVAVETMVTTGLVHVVGEVTTSGYVEIPKLVRDTIIKIGYDGADKCFDGATCGICVSIGAQSPDIASGVDYSLEYRKAKDEGLSKKHDLRDQLGAGDQGIIYGYACSDTPELMPAPIWLSHKLAERLDYVRRKEIVEGLRPDGKTMVTVAYKDGVPKSIENVLVSTQHDESIFGLVLEDALLRNVIWPVLEEYAPNFNTSNTTTIINPAGRFVIGGPVADAGLTGRKIIVDTYGGAVPHGGGAFSGKDPTKTDRSAAYAARWAAKHVIKAGLASTCLIQLAYAIGKARPVSVTANTFGTGVLTDEKLAEILSQVFDFRPLGIIEELRLLEVQYAKTASYGHFGRDIFPWEQVTKLQELKAAIS